MLADNAQRSDAERHSVIAVTAPKVEMEDIKGIVRHKIEKARILESKVPQRGNVVTVAVIAAEEELESVAAVIEAKHPIARVVQPAERKIEPDESVYGW